MILWGAHYALFPISGFDKCCVYVENGNVMPIGFNRMSFNLYKGLAGDIDVDLTVNSRGDEVRVSRIGSLEMAVHVDEEIVQGGPKDLHIGYIYVFCGSVRQMDLERLKLKAMEMNSRVIHPEECQLSDGRSVDEIRKYATSDSALYMLKELSKVIGEFKGFETLNVLIVVTVGLDKYYFLNGLNEWDMKNTVRLICPWD